MDDDFIDYYFDDISSFYAELDDILRQPCGDTNAVKKTTDQYIRFLIRFQNEFVRTTTERANAAYKLIDSTVFLEHSTTILSHILHAHALALTDVQCLPIPYSLLLYAGREDDRWMRFIVSDARRKKQNQLFRKIVDEIEHSAGKVYVMDVSVVLAFEMCKVSKLRTADLDIISAPFLNYLLDIVETTLGDAEETFNYDVIQLLLVFNEQFMMAPNGTQHNLLLDVLTNRIGTTNTFSANLIFMLNRSDDACVKMLILKLLYNIFTRPALYEYFYTNDLYVLVDIMLREVLDLGEGQEASTLRDAYLRVLKPLLINTQLRTAPYKQYEIHRMLCDIITPSSYHSVDPATQKLVQRILEEWWGEICGGTVAPLLGVDIKAPTLLGGNADSAGTIIPRTPSPYPMPPSASLSSSTSSSPSPDGKKDANLDSDQDVSLEQSTDLNRGVLCAGA